MVEQKVSEQSNQTEESGSEAKESKGKLPMRFVLPIGGVLIIAGIGLAYLGLAGKDNEDATPAEGVQTTETSKKFVREEGEVNISFVPPVNVVTHDYDNVGVSWEWSSPVEVTIENKTNVDIVIPTYGDEYNKYPTATGQAVVAMDDYIGEMNLLTLSGNDSDYNAYLTFNYYVDDVNYTFDFKGKSDIWTIPAGETVTENLYIDGGGATVVCVGATYDSACTLTEVVITLALGGKIQTEVLVTSIVEGSGYVISEPHDILTAMTY